MIKNFKLSLIRLPTSLFQRQNLIFTFWDQQSAIDDLYVTENLQNQGLIDLRESLVQAETEIANVDTDLNTLQSNLNGEYQYIMSELKNWLELSPKSEFPKSYHV